jgi:hypothetical protein
MNVELSKWIMRAGITKDITFHCARHTFAVLQLTLGTEIFTLSKLLGHSELKTTQIYAKIIDEKKREAVNKIPDITILRWIKNMNNIEAWRILIEDFTLPLQQVILQKLETLESDEDKIKYLKSEELEYLINVTLNPNLSAASGVVTTNHPQKAGLDRWIELKITANRTF